MITKIDLLTETVIGPTNANIGLPILSVTFAKLTVGVTKMKFQCCSTIIQSILIPWKIKCCL